ncbi:MAG: VOC family protein [Chloroflexota bacterium]
MANEQGSLLCGIDCIRLRIDDLEEGLAFYRDKLGQQLVWRTATAAGLKMPEADTEIVLYTAGPGETLDIKVSSANGAAEAWTRAGGTTAVGPFDIAIGRCVVVRDPWGNELVLLDDSKGRLSTDSEGNVVGVE